MSNKTFGNAVVFLFDLVSVQLFPMHLQGHVYTLSLNELKIKFTLQLQTYILIFKA